MQHYFTHTYGADWAVFVIAVIMLTSPFVDSNALVPNALDQTHFFDSGAFGPNHGPSELMVIGENSVPLPSKV